MHSRPSLTFHLFPFSVSPWCWKLALPAFGRVSVATDMRDIIERLRNENEDKTKTQMTQSSDQYSENETKIWYQNILNQFNRVSSSCIRSLFVISLIPDKSPFKPV